MKQEHKELDAIKMYGGDELWDAKQNQMGETNQSKQVKGLPDAQVFQIGIYSHSMSLSKQFESVTSADGGESSASDPALRRITDLLLKKTSFERPAVPVSGESRYLTQLWVFGNREPWEELHLSNASLPRSTSLEPRAEKSVTQNHEIKNKIRDALKLLNFREQRVLVQFWSPQAVGKHSLLTTVDQPFGVGTDDEGFFSYRSDSERNPFLVDKDDEKEDSGPPARVYRRGLPELAFDITDYTPKDFPLRESAIRCNLVGYLALPVFDSTRSCVGVLELLMSSKYMSYAYEVQQFHKALKITNLTSPQVFDWPILNSFIYRLLVTKCKMEWINSTVF
ncbi:hypothetical protein L1887_29484 [Cichorium endivia]|nr:hypothetical protein L1887_29484 [Cichorium endivia]